MVAPGMHTGTSRGLPLCKNPRAGFVRSLGLFAPFPKPPSLNSNLTVVVDGSHNTETSVQEFAQARSFFCSGSIGIRDSVEESHNGFHVLLPKQSQEINNLPILRRID